MTRADRYLARIARLQTVAECRLAVEFAMRDPKLTDNEKDAVEAAAFARACDTVHIAAQNRERERVSRLNIAMPEYMHR